MYHLALGRPIDLESIAHDAEVGLCPRHVMWGISQRLGAKPNRPKIAVFFHNIDRPRGRLVMKLFGLADKIDLFVSNASLQLDFLRNLGVSESRLLMLPEQTDTAIFTPGVSSSNQQRPIIASVDLEKRDYRLLAEATADLDVDVKISGFSKDAIAMAKAFPETLPANMSNKFYSCPDLVQLYRDADLVAVTVLLACAPSLIFTIKKHSYQLSKKTW